MLHVSIMMMRRMNEGLVKTSLPLSLSLSLSLDFFAFPSLRLTRFIPSARNQDVSLCAPHKTDFGVKASLGIAC